MMQAKAQRNLIYTVLALGAGLGVAIDAVTQKTSIIHTVNTITQILLFLGCTAGWANADARSRGARVGRLSTIFIFVFLPLGLAIYLLRSRSILIAIVVWVAYFAGIFASAMVFGLSAKLLTGGLQ